MIDDIKLKTLLTLILLELNVNFYYQYRARPAWTSVQSNQVLYCWMAKIILISPTIIIDTVLLPNIVKVDNSYLRYLAVMWFFLQLTVIYLPLVIIYNLYCFQKVSMCSIKGIFYNPEKIKQMLASFILAYMNLSPVTSADVIFWSWGGLFTQFRGSTKVLQKPSQRAGNTIRTSY